MPSPVFSENSGMGQWQVACVARMKKAERWCIIGVFLPMRANTCKGTHIRSRQKGDDQRGYGKSRVRSWKTASRTTNTAFCIERLRHH